MIFWENHAGVYFNLAAQVELKVCVCRYLGRIADTRRREDIVDKVLQIIVVCAAISEVTIWFEIFLRRNRPLDFHVLFEKLRDLDLGGDLRTLQSLSR